MDVPTRPDFQLNIARARGLMLQALEALDEIGVATDAAAHLDLAIHRLDQALGTAETDAGRGGICRSPPHTN